jgi:hypothetical protein
VKQEIPAKTEIPVKQKISVKQDTPSKVLAHMESDIKQRKKFLFLRNRKIRLR